jgi:hypothetical protein
MHGHLHIARVLRGLLLQHLQLRIVQHQILHASQKFYHHHMDMQEAGSACLADIRCLPIHIRLLACRPA